MNEAKAKPRINFLRLILFALVAIVLSGGVFAVFYLMFRQRDASLTYEKLDIDANMDYHVSGGYLTYASATDLIQVNTSDTKKSIVTNLPTAIDGFGVSSTITAVYAGSNLQLRNFKTLTLNGTIRGVACGGSHCAALRTNELNGLDLQRFRGSRGQPHRLFGEQGGQLRLRNRLWTGAFVGHLREYPGVSAGDHRPLI